MRPIQPLLPPLFLLNLFLSCTSEMKDLWFWRERLTRKFLFPLLHLVFLLSVLGSSSFMAIIMSAQLRSQDMEQLLFMDISLTRFDVTILFLPFDTSAFLFLPTLSSLSAQIDQTANLKKEMPRGRNYPWSCLSDTHHWLYKNGIFSSFSLPSFKIYLRFMGFRINSSSSFQRYYVWVYQTWSRNGRKEMHVTVTVTEYYFQNTKSNVYF